MTVHYGFFNSSNGDRVYDAEDFSRFYDGLIFDGVYSAVGNRFLVEAVGTGMYVTVDTGRAWFNHTWTFNDSKLTLEIQAADTVYDRIDAVVIEVNKDQRKNFIKTVVGTPDANPVRPTLTDTETVHQHALAYVAVPANVTEIDPSYIVIAVDTPETPLASALNLVGLPSGGNTGYILAKESPRSGAVGWYPYNQLPTDNWFKPSGVVDSDVIAAYKFKGSSSEQSALQNMNNGDNYTLTKSSSTVTWDATNGIYIPGEGAGLDNSSLRAKSWGTVAVKYASAATGDKQVGLIHKTFSTGIYANYEFTTRYVESGDYSQYHYARYTKNYPGMSNGAALETNHKYTTTPGTNPTSGVISCDLTSLANFYHNGISCAMSSPGSRSINETNYSNVRLIGNITCTAPSSKTRFGSVYIHAVVIYNRLLNSTEVAQLHTLMGAL